MRGSDTGWHAYALNGRPDFLNYLHRGDVTWTQLWEFYRESPADADAMTRLIGLFHAFTSYDYDGQGCVLDREGPVYPQLRLWARMAVECAEYLPEAKLRESLASLLSQSLVSPLYYEAAYSVFLETTIDHLARQGRADPSLVARLAGEVPPVLTERRLNIRLPDLPRYPDLEATAGWERAQAVVVRRSYEQWNRAFARALGEEQSDWLDEGGEG